MIWQQVKKDSEIKLDGIKIAIDKTGTTINEILLEDASGNKFRIANRSYNLYAEIPAPPTMVKKWVLRGEFKGLKVEEFFTYEHEATSRRYDLSDDLEIAQVEVPEEE